MNYGFGFALLFIGVTIITSSISHCAKAQEPVSKKQADAVGEAMREYKQAQIEHDCKNSVQSRSNLKIKQEILKSVIKGQEKK